MSVSIDVCLFDLNAADFVRGAAEQFQRNGCENGHDPRISTQDSTRQLLRGPPGLGTSFVHDMIRAACVLYGSKLHSLHSISFLYSAGLNGRV